jgi:hypothetical protein
MITTDERLAQLEGLLYKDAPWQAQSLVKFLGAKYGVCGEVIIEAYKGYLIVIEKTTGGEASPESRRFLESLPQFQP